MINSRPPSFYRAFYYRIFKEPAKRNSFWAYYVGSCKRPPAKLEDWPARPDYAGAGAIFGGRAQECRSDGGRGPLRTIRRVCVCVCVCARVSIYICIYIYMHASIHTNTYVYAFVHLSIHI